MGAIAGSTFASTGVLARVICGGFRGTNVRQEYQGHNTRALERSLTAAVLTGGAPIPIVAKILKRTDSEAARGCLSVSMSKLEGMSLRIPR